MFLSDDPIIKCNRCGTSIRIPKDMLEDDPYSIGSFNMGVRVQHDFAFEGNCMQCGNDLFFKIIGYEYPVGAIDYQDHESSGCTVENAPAIEIDYYDFDIPEEYENWIADDVASLIDQIKQNREIAYRITPRQFEELVAEVFRRNGYSVELTPAVNDGGKDVIAKRNVDGIPICLYIECKHYDPSDPVGVGIVRAASAVRSHDRVNKAIIVTTSRFTRGASRFANEEKHMIQLMGLDDLLRMM